MRDLEQYLGYDLFHRFGKRITPTEQAQALYTVVRRSYVGLEEISRAATAIGGRSLAFSPAHLRRTLLRQPLLTLGVVARIHWQALRLWWRGVPLHHKPAPPLASTSQPPTPQENHP